MRLAVLAGGRQSTSSIFSESELPAGGEFLGLMSEGSGNMPSAGGVCLCKYILVLITYIAA